MGQLITLEDVQHEKMRAGDATGAMVVDLVRRGSNILDILPFETIGTVETGHTRTDSVPTISWRSGRGASFGTVTTVGEDYVADAIYSVGTSIDIDITDLRDTKQEGIVEKRVRDALKAITWEFNDKFVNGDHASNAHAFEGINVRFANNALATNASDISVYGDTSSAELDVRMSASPSETVMYQFLDRIDQAIDALDGATGDIAVTDRDFIAALRSVLRRLGKYTDAQLKQSTNTGQQARETFANAPSGPALIYPEDKGIRWYEMGLKADQSTRIVGTETVNSQACRPVYFVKLGEPYLYGIQQYPIEVGDPFVLDDGVTHRTNVHWPLGLHHAHVRSITKLRGVRVA